MTRPILFSTDMVRAILDGRKTQTRRIVVLRLGETIWESSCRKYVAEDTLWVRETWFYEMHMQDREQEAPDLPSGCYSHRYVYKADSPEYPVDIGVGATGWRPSIYMPREAARLFLRVTDVRAERLQDITEADALAEGMRYDGKGSSRLWTARDAYIDLWDKLNAKRGFGWDSNPYVWVIEFEKIEKEAPDDE